LVTLAGLAAYMAVVQDRPPILRAGWLFARRRSVAESSGRFGRRRQSFRHPAPSVVEAMRTLACGFCERTATGGHGLTGGRTLSGRTFVNSALVSANAETRAASRPN
jgi:hypothetical protein